MAFLISKTVRKSDKYQLIYSINLSTFLMRIDFVEYICKTKRKNMKIPIIKHLVNFVEANDEDYIHETIEVLESLADVPTLKDEELEVIGELISNLYGAIEVNKEITSGVEKKDALNGFMKRVLGSIN